MIVTHSGYNFISYKVHLVT